MVRSGENPSRSVYRWIAPRAAVAIAAFLLASKLAPDNQGGDGKPAVSGAAALERNIRHGQPVSYNANLGVGWVGRKPDGELVDETTIMPLVRDPDRDPATDNTQYFRLVGGSLRTIRVRRIPAPIDLAPQHWDSQHPGVTVTSHRGVVSADNLAGIPATTIELSDGRNELLAVGQTSATP